MKTRFTLTFIAVASVVNGLTPGTASAADVDANAKPPQASAAASVADQAQSALEEILSRSNADEETSSTEDESNIKTASKPDVAAAETRKNSAQQKDEKVSNAVVQPAASPAAQEHAQNDAGAGPTATGNASAGESSGAQTTVASQSAEKPSAAEASAGVEAQPADQHQTVTQSDSATSKVSAQSAPVELSGTPVQSLPAVPVTLQPPATPAPPPDTRSHIAISHSLAHSDDGSTVIVTLDGKDAGTLKKGVITSLEVKPGKHKIGGYVRTLFGMGRVTIPAVDVTATSGALTKVDYTVVKDKPGFKVVDRKQS